MSPKSRCCCGGGQRRVLSTQGKGWGRGFPVWPVERQQRPPEYSASATSTPAPSCPLQTPAHFSPLPTSPLSRGKLPAHFLRRTLVPTSKRQGLFKSCKRPQRHRHPQSVDVGPQRWSERQR